MKRIRNNPYPVAAPEEHKRFRGVITTRSITLQKVGERLWGPNGQGYAVNADGSLQRTSDPLTDFLYAEMGREMNRNDFAGRLTGSQFRQYRRLKRLKAQYPKKADKELRHAASSHYLFDAYLRDQAKQQEQVGV